MLITDHHPYVQIRILKQMVKGCLYHHIINPSFGRHVALDKLLGRRAEVGEGGQHGAALVSSRASYEMVQKAAMCGVEILFAVSAATTLAVEVAERCNLTLVGFCKPGRATVYTHPQRLIAG